MDIWGEEDEDAVVPAPDFGDHVDESDDEGLPAVPAAPPGAAEPEPEPEEDEDDGGISDADRIVRVWVEDGRLTKVSVSPNWYRKLERRRNADLGRIISVVLQMAHVGVPAPGSTVTQRQSVELTPEFKRTLPELSEGSLARMGEHFAALERRVDATKRERAAAGPGRVPETVGRVKGVTVRLNGAGHATTVEFDETWLDTAQAGNISSGVLRAAKDAYSRYRPPADDDALSGLISREYDYMRKVMYTIMTPKEQR